MGWNIHKEDFIENKHKYYRKIRKDIEVYKIGIVANNDYFVPSFQKDFTYSVNIINEEIKLNIVNGITKDILTIHKGYHSFSGKCHITLEDDDYDEKHPSLYVFPKKRSSSYCCGGFYQPAYELFIGKFIIPKSSYYYEDENGEIVSSNIIYVGEYFKPIELDNLYLETHNLKDICVGV